MPSATNWLANYFSLSPLASDPGITSTSTFSYDKNGNLTQKIEGATTTTYVYDYLNRLTALRSTGDTATTTYAYDAFSSRVLQGNGIATTTYPNKFYSIVSSTSGATTTATSTLYAYDGSTLLATIDTPQTTVGATTTTATSTTHYIHADNLGSTQATSDQNGLLSQYFDYAPYGSVLASTSTNPAAAVARQYIGQFSDASGLSYLNARYYEAGRGQFLSQDPMFLGNPSQQNLADPQSLNAYSYSDDNPITNEDPTGKWFQQFLTGQQSWPSFQGELGQAANTLGQSSSVWNYALGHPYLSGATVGLTSGVLAYPIAGSATAAWAAANAASFPGVGTGYAAAKTFASLFYSTITAAGIKEVPAAINNFLSVLSNPSQNSYLSAAGQALNIAPSFMGEYISTIGDIYNFASIGVNSTINLVGNHAQSSMSNTGGARGTQTSALFGVVNAFTPSNSSQAKAVQNVVSAFTGTK